jgi:hypothetical protein
MRLLRYQTELYTDEIARNYRRSDIKHLCNINVIDPVSKAAKSIVNSAGIIAWTLENLRQAITENVKKISVESIRDLKTMTTAAVHTIKMKPGTQPRRAKMRKMAFAYEKKFAQTVKDMLASGRIQPSNSPWASAVRIVGKPDGSIRTTID